MSAERRGRADGRQDAEFDITQDLARRPRPRFVSAFLSDRYRLAYMTSYKRTFDAAIREKENRIASELAANSKLISGGQVPRDQVFERGWRDGYAGSDTPPKGYAHDEIKTYERGHRSGQQHREWELAKQLREKALHQLSR